MPENTYQQAAGTQTAFAQGFSDMLRHLLESSNQTAQQAAGGTVLSPESQAPVGDVLYGLGGYFPAQEMAQAGAGWQSFFNQAPSFTEQILNRNASQYSALASANARARAASSADDKSMTEYQAASLAMRQAELDRSMSNDDLDRELAMARFELDTKRYSSDNKFRQDAAKLALMVFGRDTEKGKHDMALADRRQALAERRYRTDLKLAQKKLAAERAKSKKTAAVKKAIWEAQRTIDIIKTVGVVIPRGGETAAEAARRRRDAERSRRGGY